MIDPEEYLYFVDRSLDGMIRIVLELDDERACQRPDLTGANHAYGILNHCLGVIETWSGGLIRGRSFQRDRHREFIVCGPVQDLVARAQRVRATMAADLERSDFAHSLAVEPPVEYEGPDRLLTQGGAWQHIYEELAQHHGQMQLVRDLVVATGGTLSPTPSRGPR